MEMHPVVSIPYIAYIIQCKNYSSSEITLISTGIPQQFNKHHLQACVYNSRWGEWTSGSVWN